MSEASLQGGTVRAKERRDGMTAQAASGQLVCGFGQFWVAKGWGA